LEQWYTHPPEERIIFSGQHQATVLPPIAQLLGIAFGMHKSQTRGKKLLDKDSPLQHDIRL
jgi:hypothetical protein